MSTRFLSKASLWFIRKLPPPLVADTERIGLSLGFIAVGILSSLYLAQEQIRPLAYPLWIVYCWTISLITGGVFTIAGIWTGNRVTERFGLMMSLLGCTTYGLANVTLGWDGPKRLIITGVLFLLFALIKLIRLAASSAASATVNDDAGGRD